MRTRWFTSSLAGVTALALLATSGCGEQAAAIKVGDSYVSQSDFMDEVREVHDYLQEVDPSVLLELDDDADSPADLEESTGSYSQAFVANVAEQRVSYMLTEELVDEEGLEVSDADLAEVRAEMEVQPGYDTAPTWLQDRAVALEAMMRVLSREVDPERLDEASREVLDGTEVSVNSKYGTWRADTMVAGQDSLATTGVLFSAREAPIVPPAGPLLDVDDAESTDGPDADGGRQLDPALVEMMAQYGLDVADLGPAELEQFASQLEAMGMDPADLTADDMAQLETQLQMELGAGAGAPVPAP